MFIPGFCVIFTFYVIASFDNPSPASRELPLHKGAFGERIITALPKRGKPFYKSFPRYDRIYSLSAEDGDAVDDDCKVRSGTVLGLDEQIALDCFGLGGEGAVIDNVSAEACDL